MELNILQDTIRKQVLDLINQGKCKFNDLKKEVKIDSNKLAYHLKKLINSGFIVLQNGKYVLSEECNNIFPYRKIITQKQMPVMPVTSVAIIKNGKVLLQKKPNEPNRGCLILFGGTVKFTDTISDSAINEVFNQAGVHIKNLKLRAISESLVLKNKLIKQHWVVNFYTATSDEKPRNGKWYSLKKLPRGLFLDNKFFLTKARHNKYPKLYRLIKNTSEIKVEIL